MEQKKNSFHFLLLKTFFVSLVDEFESVIDLAESLMTVEDLSWASLFHHRYMCSGRLMRLSELDHIKAVTEVCFPTQAWFLFLSAFCFVLVFVFVFLICLFVF